MTTSEMTDDELNEAIAAALGGALVNPGWYWFRGTGGTDGFPDMPDVPGQEPMFSRCPENAFASSLDALSAVEQRLLAAGYWLTVTLQGEMTRAYWWTDRGPLPPAAEAPKESRARAEAVYLGLLALQALTSITTLASRETIPDAD